ncbi:VOC family protein [Gluconacetobacter diazotrophicus]|uniref:VOC family protein n=1 Tax=Gluconacetobacter diazotrophicus TaxID=33996 RepID=A0A7W4I3H3_GLUDI|nr:VOC family protein [Gluconacetobacter diazotrophicus]MBB2155073.1 VOC family protein [Gluconacetobacter diazotrophicus]TWB09770.1 hypothetical protein FBZ86_10350 [Gluconacetobacter diazotrophicus]
MSTSTMLPSVDRFVWYELVTTDADAATAFYRSVIGWSARDSGLPDWHYTMLSAGDRPVGGLLEVARAARDDAVRTGWIGYVAVGDVDAVAARVTQAGGAIHRAPQDIPGVGRFAVVADPQGAIFALFQATGEDPMPPVQEGTPGHVGWHELHAIDREAAFGFYAGLFGWTKAETMDMGPMGIYQLFATGGPPVGGMMKKADSVPAPFWLYYFNTEEIGPAIARVHEAGGTLINGPHHVPGERWIAQCRDPQGAIFAMVAPKP